MNPKRWSAVSLVLLMTFAGCLGATEPAKPLPEPTEETYRLEATMVVAPDETKLGEEATFVLRVDVLGEGVFESAVSVLDPSFSPVESFEWTEQSTGFQLSFTPSVIGQHIVSISFENTGETVMSPSFEPLVLGILVTAPEEPAPVLTTPGRLVLEEPNVVWFEGRVEHAAVSSCDVRYEISDGTVSNIALDDDGKWKILLDFTEASSSHTITTTASCGRFSVLSDTTSTQVLIEGAGDDEDGDGIQNTNDRCPNGIGANEGWQSTTATDGDQDGCRDNDEDEDDDNDGIVDMHDGCPESYG